MILKKERQCREYRPNVQFMGNPAENEDIMEILNDA